MPIVADVVENTIGVDSHRDSNTAGAIDAGNSGVLGDIRLPTGTAGYQAMLDWANKTTSPSRLWAIEGTGSYGAGLFRFLVDHGEWVIEVERPGRKRSKAAKDDRIDAIRAGREALGQDLDDVISPRQGKVRDGLAALVTARHAAVQDAKGARNQFHATVVTAPAGLRERFETMTTTQQLKAAAKLRPGNYKCPAEAGSARAMRSAAQRWSFNQTEAKDLQADIAVIVKEWRPDLLELKGVGPIVAAVVLCAWSHPQRFATREKFAMFAGCAPIPASSGLTTGRVRLNPSGDRQLNSMIHTIVLCRLRSCPETIAYRDRRRAQGKTDRDIRRQLKTYVARQLHQTLKQAA